MQRKKSLTRHYSILSPPEPTYLGMFKKLVCAAIIFMYIFCQVKNSDGMRIGKES